MEKDNWQPDYYSRYSPEHQPRPRAKFLQRLFSKDRIHLNFLLFFLTCITTYLVAGFIYSITIMTILLAHEMGHYLMCKKHGISSTLPFFIPIPFAFGTGGAFIAMRQQIPNRRALFDIGAAGPLAGFVFIVPALVIGVYHSTIIDLQNYNQATITMGEPLILKFITYIIYGPLAEGEDILIHPLAYAGWFGLLVTAVNLLPVGQLDGGHISYALFGQKSKYVSFAALVFFAISTYLFIGWILMLILITFFLFKHPPPLNDQITLDLKRKIIGYLMFLIFILSFTPVPFK